MAETEKQGREDRVVAVSISRPPAAFALRFPCKDFYSYTCPAVAAALSEYKRAIQVPPIYSALQLKKNKGIGIAQMFLEINVRNVAGKN